MDQSERCRPACGIGDYGFGSRKKNAEECQPEQWETKYRCKGCNHEWKDRMPVLPKKEAG